MIKEIYDIVSAAKTILAEKLTEAAKDSITEEEYNKFAEDLDKTTQAEILKIIPNVEELYIENEALLEKLRLLQEFAELDPKDLVDPLYVGKRIYRIRKLRLERKTRAKLLD